MKRIVVPNWVLVPLCSVVLAVILAPPGVRAAEEELQPPRPRPNMEELRERFRSMPPEDRQRLLREFRERRGLSVTNHSEWEAFREELRQLPPDQREQRIQELRRRAEQVPPQFRVLTPQERETKRKQMKERVTTQISQLRSKKAEGSLTEVEARRLQRMEQMADRLEQGAVLGPKSGGPVAGLPVPKHPESSRGTNKPDQKLNPPSPEPALQSPSGTAPGAPSPSTPSSAPRPPARPQ